MRTIVAPKRPRELRKARTSQAVLAKEHGSGIGGVLRPDREGEEQPQQKEEVRHPNNRVNWPPFP